MKVSEWMSRLQRQYLRFCRRWSPGAYAG